MKYRILKKSIRDESTAEVKSVFVVQEKRWYGWVSLARQRLVACPKETEFVFENEALDFLNNMVQELPKDEEIPLFAYKKV